MLAVSLAFPFAAIGVINVAFDPYQDFAYLTGRKGAPPTTVFNYAELKYKLSLANEIAGRSAIVLLGSSTTAGIDPDLGRLAVDVPVYNLAFSGAGIYQIEAMVQRLAQLNPKPRLIVGLDFFGAKAQAVPDLLYLRSDDASARVDALRRLVAPLPTFDWIRGRAAGGLTFAPRGWRIFTRPRAVKDELSVGETTGRHYYSEFRIAADYRDRLLRIAAAAPDARFFVSPLHGSHYALLSQWGLDGVYCDWLALVTSTVDASDFSFIPETMSAVEFVDTEHYRPELGFRLLETVLSPKTRPAPLGRAACLAKFQQITIQHAQAHAAGPAAP